MKIQTNLSSRQRMVTLRGSLQASRAFPTLLWNTMRTSISAIISSNFSSNSFFTNWMSLTRWSEQQKEKTKQSTSAVSATSPFSAKHRLIFIFIFYYTYFVFLYLPSRLLSSFCMRLHALSVSCISLMHSALKSSDWFRITSLVTRLDPTPCWGLRPGTDIVLHWWFVTDSIGREEEHKWRNGKKCSCLIVKESWKHFKIRGNWDLYYKGFTSHSLIIYVGNVREKGNI